MTTMRAKVRVTKVEVYASLTVGAVEPEKISFCGVGRNDYPADGSDENNTYAKFTPQLDFSLTIANPDLLGKFSVGDQFYVNFTPVSK